MPSFRENYQLVLRVYIFKVIYNVLMPVYSYICLLIIQ